MRTTILSISFAFLLLVGCSQSPLESKNDIFLETLAFSGAEVKSGEPVGLLATVSGNVGKSQMPTITITQEEDAKDVQLQPWSELTDGELLGLIEETEGRAFVGFKEADQETGVSPEGEVLVSDETVNQMIEWLEEKEASINMQYDLPAVSVMLPADLDVIETLRGHDNVEYVQPIFAGERMSSSAAQKTDLILLLGAGGETLSPGEVTAEYVQPDGEVLVERTVVK